MFNINDFGDKGSYTKDEIIEQLEKENNRLFEEIVKYKKENSHLAVNLEASEYAEKAYRRIIEEEQEKHKEVI